MAAQSRGSVNVFVQPEKLSLEAMATEFFSSCSVSTWNSSSAAAFVQLHVAQLVDAEQVDPAVTGDRLGQHFLIGRLDQFR